ncbi:MAG: PAS domain S-box protein, partial [Pseudomonadota bacterium]
MLNVAVPFSDKGVKFGEVLVELPLPLVTEMLGNHAGLGKTGEMLLCAPTGKNRMKCFPSRHRPEGFETARLAGGKPLPMSYALDGESGVVTTVDYRDQAVLAAVRPIGNLGLGMAVKKDVSETSQALTAHILLVLPGVVFLVILGIGLQRWGLVPQVRALVASRARMSAMTDNLAVGVVAFDGNGTIELFNPAAAKIFGYAPGEAIGQNIRMLVPESSQSRLDPYLGKGLQFEASTVMGAGAKAIKGRRKNGDNFPMDFSVREVVLSGRPLFVAMARDITARVRTEEALRESEKGQRRLAEQQTAILEALPASIVLLDREGSIITANRAWWQQASENGGFNIGSNYLAECGESGAPPDSSFTQVTEGIRAVLKGEKPFFTTEYPRPDETGIPCWIRTIVNPLQPGKNEGVVIMSLDVTERKLAEEARSRFVAILEATTDFVCMADASGRVFYLNKAGRQARKIGKEEDVSQLHIADFYPYWASRIISDEALPAAAADGAWAGETAFIGGDGREIPVLQVVLAHKTADGMVDYYSTIMHDIGQRKRSEEELRASHAELQQAYRRLEEAQSHMLQSEKMASIGQLAAGVAHEINNPIGYVSSNLGMLEKYLAEMLTLLDAYEKAEAEPAENPAALSLIKAAKEGIDLSFLKEDMPALMSESKEGISRVKQIVQNLKDFSHVGAEDEWQWADLHKGLD